MNYNTNIYVIQEAVFNLKNSLVTGAVILMIANTVSKILGAILKIPLTYIIHEEGMAVYNTAYSVYVMALSLAVSGVPFAVTKVVAAEKAKGKVGRAKGTVITAVIILSLIGITVSFAMYFGAEFFAMAMKEPKALWAIRAIAPSVAFVAVGAAFKSGFQGESNMIPTAASQCIEAVTKLAAGYFFALFLAHLGRERAAAGATAGVSVGEFVATLILAMWYLLSKRKTVAQAEGVQKDIMDIAIPIWGLSVITSAIGVLDTSLLRWGLIRSGLSEAEARYLYGAYSGYAMTVLNLPVGLLATLGVSVVPIVSGAVAVGNMLRVRSVTKKGMILAFLGGAGAVVFLALFGEDILDLLFNNTASWKMLLYATPSVLFICLMQFTGAVLQAMGKMGCVFISATLAGVIKLLSAVFLVSRPEINIYGAVIGTDVAYFVGMVMNIIFLIWAQRMRVEITG